MTDPNALPVYPPLSNPTTGGTRPNYEQVPYVQQPYVQPGGHVQYVYNVGIDPSTTRIHDWLVWSIINIFIGWFFAGIIPLIFSLVCRHYKSSNNASGARTMSILALVFNILITVGGIAGWIALIVLLVVANRTVYNSCINSLYC